MEEEMIKMSDLRKMNLPQLHEKLIEVKRMHTSSRTSQEGGKSIKIKLLRHQIARIKLAITQRMIHDQKVKYKGAKYVPKDLRPKKTHALRLKLDRKQRLKKTLRQKKRCIHFPDRVYAVKATLP